MKVNGTLKIALLSASENEYGEQVHGSIEWTKPFDCCISTNSDNRIGKYEDGEFRSSAYTILLESSESLYEAMAAESGTLVATGSDGGTINVPMSRPIVSRVSLSRHGEFLGEFRVQSVETFPSVGRIQINVV